MNKIIKTFLVCCFWVCIWWCIAFVVDKEILIVSPLALIKRMGTLFMTPSYYYIVFCSIVRIIFGFFSALILGVLFGILASKFAFVDVLFSPIFTIMKTTPVASFIILALVWLDRQILPSFIAFLMVLPLFYDNIKEGMKNIRVDLKEMCAFYQIPYIDRIKKMYVPLLFPYFIASVKSTIGLSWKAGVAAEVLCNPSFSIGQKLYEAKTYLNTLDVFAWTTTILIISIIIEKIIVYCIDVCMGKGVHHDTNSSIKEKI